MLNFNGQYPTRDGAGVKWLAQHLGAAAVLLAAGVAWFARSRRDEDIGLFEGEQPGRDESRGGRGSSSEISAATAAQVGLLGLACWAMLSGLWAQWPAAAFGEGARLLFVVVWAVALGRTMSGWAVRGASLAMVAVLVVTAILGIWYRWERSPVMRLEFPIGNPIFLAACLIPGLMLTGTILIGGLTAVVARVSRPASSGVEESCPITSVARDTGFFASRRGWWLLAGSVIGLVALAWAFWLTGSRGPQIGLAVGAFVIVCLATLWLPRWAKWLILIVLLLVVVLAGGLWLRSQLTADDAGRAATIRLRFYAWKHALDLALDHPVVGNGQAGYALLATELSGPDREYDRAAFAAPHLGHAHSEWLETMTDLGVIGIALYGTALALTFWAGVSALRRPMAAIDRWCLAALLGAFVAIIVEEAADVALRKPGLPIIFYTTIGLIWARSRDPGAPGSGFLRRSSQATRLAVLVGVIAGSAGIVSAAWRDWEGALALQGSITHSGRADGEWDESVAEQALALARTGGSHRLAVEDYLVGGSQEVRVAHRAAGSQVRRIREMLRRFDEQEWEKAIARQIAREESVGFDPGLRQITAQLDETGTDLDTILALAREDSERFDWYFDVCITTGERLLERMPGHYQVAGMMSGMWRWREEMTAAERRLGLPGPAARQRLHWARLEYERDRFDAERALDLLTLLPEDEPLIGRVNLLRIPLRTTARYDETFTHMERQLAVLMQRQNVDPLLDELRNIANLAAREPDAGRWPDPYSPETFRLAALAASGFGFLFAMPLESGQDLETGPAPQALREEFARRGRPLSRSAFVWSAPREGNWLIIDGNARYNVIGSSQGSRVYRQGDVVKAAELAGEAVALAGRIRSRFPRAASYAGLDHAHYLLLAYPYRPQLALEVCRQAVDDWPPSSQREAELEPLRRGLCRYLLAAGEEQEAIETLRALDPRLAEPGELQAQIEAYLGTMCLTAQDGTRSLAERIELLRVVMRRVGRYTEAHKYAEMALNLMMQEPDFAFLMDQFVTRARDTERGTETALDPYAPETLRLAAMAGSRLAEDGVNSVERYREAAQLSGRAALLARKLCPTSPVAASYARLDEAHWLLLADPDTPHEAVAICRKVIDECPKADDQQFWLRPVRLGLVRCLLAAGDERAALGVLRMLGDEASPEELVRRLGSEYVGLCQTFWGPPDDRPAAFVTWLERAIRMAPWDHAAQSLAARLAYEGGDARKAADHLAVAVQTALEQDDNAAATIALRFSVILALEESWNAAAIDHVIRMRAVLNDDRQLLEFLQSLWQRFPNHPALRVFVGQPGPVTSAPAVSTTPAGPGSRPATRGG